MTSLTTLFAWGMLAMACIAIGLLFLRLWRLSGERLLLFFALGFLVFALNWIGLGLAHPTEESRHWFYLVRMLAFALIIVGIVDKNRSRREAARAAPQGTRDFAPRTLR